MFLLTPSSIGGAPDAKCKLCTRNAVGPCARCRAPVCGNCCELTDGGATTFALCLTCVKRGGSTLAPAYRDLLMWLGLVILGLVGIVALTFLARR